MPVPVQTDVDRYTPKPLAKHSFSYSLVHQTLIGDFTTIQKLPHVFSVTKGKLQEYWQLLKANETKTESEFILQRERQCPAHLPPAELGQMDGTTITSYKKDEVLQTSILDKLAHIAIIRESEVHLRPEEAKENRETLGILMTWEITLLLLSALRCADVEGFAKTVQDIYDGKTEADFEQVGGVLDNRHLSWALELSSFLYQASSTQAKSQIEDATLSLGDYSIELTIDESENTILDHISFTDQQIAKHVDAEKSFSIRLTAPQKLVRNTDGHETEGASITLDFSIAGVMIYQNNTGRAELPFNPLLLGLFEIYKAILKPVAN